MHYNHQDLFSRTGKLHGGISAEQIRAEIQHMIDEVFLNESEETLALWSKMASNGKKPTPEELVDYCVIEMRKRKRRGLMKRRGLL